MRKNDQSRISEISSFKELREEKERLMLNKKLVKVKMNYSFLYLKKSISLSNLTSSFLRNTIFKGEKP